MKHTLQVKLILFLLVFSILLSPICMASNTSDTSDNTIENTNSTYEYITSDIYEFDDNVTIDSIIDGNAFAFGTNVNITGEIGGDIFVFGETVTVEKNAYIHGNIFVFASTFNMNGICYDIYGAGQEFTLGKDAIVARDIRIASDKVTINGQVKRDAYLTVSELAFADNSTNLIAGNLEYTAPSEFAIAENVVGGEIKFTQEVTEEATTSEKITAFVFELIAALLYSLVIVLLTIWFAPNFKNKVGYTLKKKAPLSLGIGLLTSVIIIVGALILLFLPNGITAGISFAAITIFILALTISQTVFSMGCAKLVAEKFKKDNLPIFIGITLLTVVFLHLIGLLPILGGLINFLATMLGFGIILVHLMRKNNIDENKTEVNNSTVKE